VAVSVPNVVSVTREPAWAGVGDNVVVGADEWASCTLVDVSLA
jgi:hypothetical protein